MPVTVQASRARRASAPSTRPGSRQAAAPRRAGGSGQRPSSKAAAALSLQRTAGNAAVRKLLTSSTADLATSFMPAIPGLQRSVVRDDGPATAIPRGTITSDAEIPDIPVEPAQPDPAANAAIALAESEQNALVEKGIAAASQQVTMPDTTYFLLKPIALAYNAAAGAIDRVGNFASNLATAGANAAVSFAKKAILTVAASAGPIGWILGAAASIVDHFGQFSAKAANFIVTKIMAKVTDALNIARTYTASAFIAINMSAIKLIHQGQKMASVVVDDILVTVNKLVSAIQNNPVVQYLTAAIRQITNVWNAIVRSVPPPLCDIIHAPTINVPDLGLGGS